MPSQTTALPPKDRATLVKTVAGGGRAIITGKGQVKLKNGDYARVIVNNNIVMVAASAAIYGVDGRVIPGPDPDHDIEWVDASAAVEIPECWSISPASEAKTTPAEPHIIWCATVAGGGGFEIAKPGRGRTRDGRLVELKNISNEYWQALSYPYWYAGGDPQTRISRGGYWYQNEPPEEYPNDIVGIEESCAKPVHALHQRPKMQPNSGFYANGDDKAEANDDASDAVKLREVVKAAMQKPVNFDHLKPIDNRTVAGGGELTLRVGKVYRTRDKRRVLQVIRANAHDDGQVIYSTGQDDWTDKGAHIGWPPGQPGLDLVELVGDHQL